MSSNARKQWCQEQAREFFQNKADIAKRYLIDYYYPEMYSSDWLLLSAFELEEFHDFDQKEREDFLRANPDEADNDDLWQEWLNDAYLDANFTIDDCPDGGCTAEVKRVYLDRAKNTYLFQLAILNEKSGTFDTVSRYIDLDDEEYICLLAMVLDKKNASMSEVLAEEPDIFRKIVSQCFLLEQTCAFFLDEIRQDAKSILDAKGDSMPLY